MAETAIRTDERTVAARLVGYPTAPVPILNQIRLKSGSMASTDGEVVVEKHLAEALALDPGDSLEVALADGWRTVAVSGVAVSAEYLWPARSRQEIFVLPDQWGVLFLPPNLVEAAPVAAISHQVLVGYADRAELDAGLTDLANRTDATGAFTRAEQPSNAALQEDIDGFGELSLMFPTLFLGAAGMAVYVLLGRLVRSQHAEIGVLLALGLSRRKVITHYLGFGVVAALMGGVPGALLGAVLGGLITDIYTSVLGIPTRVIVFYPETPVIAIAFAVLVSLLAALVPALRASRLTPADAMRGVAAARGGESVLERLLPPLRRLPGRWNLVVRGLGRSRARSIATVIGIILSVTLVLTSWGLLDTIEVLLDRQFGQIERQSIEAITLAPVREGDVATVQEIGGVAAAEPVVRLPVGISTDRGTYGTSLVGFRTDTTMHSFLAPDGSWRGLPETGLLIGDALRDRLGITGESTVRVTTEGGVSGELEIAGFVHEPLGTFAYASLDYLASTLGADTVSTNPRSIFVRLTDGAARGDVRAALSDLPVVVTTIDSEAIRELLDQFMGLFYAFVGIMFVLGALLAFALIYATISANVSERTVELANLQASGMSVGQIGRLITAENLLLATIGIVPGLVVGYVGAAVFMAAFSSDLFAFDLQVRPLSLLMAAAAAMAAVALSLVPTLRAVASVDLGKVVRERAT